MPEVADGEIGLIAEPGFLNIIHHADQNQPHTAVSWHFVRLIPDGCVFLTKRKKERGVGGGSGRKMDKPLAREP